MRTTAIPLSLVLALSACGPAPSPPPQPASAVKAPATPLPPLLPPSEPWPCAQEGDVDKDGQPDKVTFEKGRPAIVVRGEPFAIPLPAAAITRACLGDLDGDGTADIAVGVVRPTTKDGTFRERVFVYQFQNGLRSHFLGTEAAGTLLHFGVADLDGDQKHEVVARESTKGEEATRVYRWEGYGFHEEKELAPSAPPYRYHPDVLEIPSFRASPRAEEPKVPPLGWNRGPASAKSVEVRTGLSNVANLASFRWLGQSARRHIEQHGFAVIQPEQPPFQFHGLYIQNQYEGIPSFVTADTALNFTHIVFDSVLQEAEENVLGPALARLVSGMRFQGRLLRSRVPKAMAPALDRVLLRVHVAESLLVGNLDDVPADLRAAVQQELDAIEALSTSPSGLVTNYGAFVVRGHYTKTEALQRFFKAHLLMATSRTSDPREVALLSALALSNPTHRRLLHTIDGLTHAMVGPSANASVLDLVEKARSAFGEEPGWELLDTDARWFEPLPPSRALGGPSVGLLSRRWPADNDIFADPERTTLPDPLELLGALGSQRARHHLQSTKDAKAATARVDRYAAAFRSGRLGDPRAVAGRWLLSLRWTLLPYPEGYPSFQRTDAWADHGLVSAAAAWTELRRDTILHVEPPIVWAEGGDEDALPPGKAAYVEPIPELYHELADVLDGVAKAYEAHAGTEAPDRVERSRTLLLLFEAASRRQLEGQGLSKEQHLALQQTGEVLERVLAGGNGALQLDPVPVIADVAHLHDPDSGGRLSMLMAATGPVDVIVVAVPLGTRVVLARGAVSSFYHFPSSEFMTDEAWRKQLAEGQAPPRPTWAQSIPGKWGPPVRLDTRR